MSTIEQPPLSQLIADQLKNEIWNGKLRFGERLIEAELAERFQVSRSSLREALKILENEELVYSKARRGSYVAQFSKQDLREIIELRSLLEVHAFVNALPHLEAQHIQHLAEIVAEMKEKTSMDNWNDLFNLDMQFHRYVVQLCGNSKIKKVYDSLQVQIRTALSQLNKYYSTVETFYQEHQELLDALLTKDSQKVEQTVRQHIEYVEEQLLK